MAALVVRHKNRIGSHGRSGHATVSLADSRHGISFILSGLIILLP